MPTAIGPIAVRTNRMLCRCVRQIVKNARPRPTMARTPAGGRSTRSKRGETARKAARTGARSYRSDRAGASSAPRAVEEVPGGHRQRPLDRVEHFIKARSSEHMSKRDETGFRSGSRRRYQEPPIRSSDKAPKHQPSRCVPEAATTLAKPLLPALHSSDPTMRRRDRDRQSEQAIEHEGGVLHAPIASPASAPTRIKARHCGRSRNRPRATIAAVP